MSVFIQKLPTVYNWTLNHNLWTYFDYSLIQTLTKKIKKKQSYSNLVPNLFVTEHKAYSVLPYKMYEIVFKSKIRIFTLDISSSWLAR